MRPGTAILPGSATFEHPEALRHEYHAIEPPASMSSYAGQTAVVTGAASGIGFALSRELVQEGAVVYAADLNAAGLDLLRAECGERVRPCELNVCDEARVQALLERAVAEQGALNLLFNNAGIVVGGPFEDMDSGTWQRIVDINLWGVIHGTQHAYRLMRAQGHGHIVNTASTAGLAPVARSCAYAATKHAVVGLSTSLREEGRAFGVRVSVAIPGLVDTNIFASATNLADHDYAAAMRRVPIRKISPQQAAQAILRGVARNQQFIVFPGYNRLICTLNRWLPGGMARLLNRGL